MADVEKNADEVAAEALQKDVEGFNGELIPLLGKYNVGLGATAFITPDGRIGARPTLFRAPEAEKKPEAAAPAEEAPAAPAAPEAPAPSAPAAPEAPAAPAPEAPTAA